MTTPPTNVPIGLASKTGYGVALAGLIGAVLAYLTGDHSQAQLGSIVSATVAAISLVVTQIGRYVQANSQIKSNAELSRLYADSRTAIKTVEQYDPAAMAQVETIVRNVLKDEIARLPATARTVATDLENMLLPTPEEEAAHQPPSASAPSGP